MKPEHVVEAALFSAGGPIGVDEIQEGTGLTKKQVNDALAWLAKEYKDRDTALEVGKAGTKWAMQVRAQAADEASKFAPMEIPKKVLKTLALIAYHQPMKQSELKDMIGSKVYDHVAELKERGLVKTRRDGITKIITTTAAFPEYFGLEAASNDEVRAVMANLVGLPPPKKREEKELGGFEAAEGGQDAAPPVEEDGAPEAAEDETAAVGASDAPEPMEATEPPQSA